MTKFHAAAMLLAVGSLAALPACSTMPGHTSVAAARASNPELSPTMVREVQTTLQQQGFYTGNIDGIWGPGTQGATLNFQRSHALRATGQLDSATLAALNGPVSSAAPVMQTAAPVATVSSAAPIAPPMAPATADAPTSSAAPAVAPTP
jgi:peptidoglycan hydrolase-like protein with peptidoglycan-binding domain